MQCLLISYRVDHTLLFLCLLCDFFCWQLDILNSLLWYLWKSRSCLSLVYFCCLERTVAFICLGIFKNYFWKVCICHYVLWSLCSFSLYSASVLVEISMNARSQEKKLNEKKIGKQEEKDKHFSIFANGLCFGAFLCLLARPFATLP